MKIYISSYNVVSQNSSGGVQVRIKNYLKNINSEIDIKLFDMWSDKLDDCDILHVFKANIDSYSLMIQAKEKGKKIVLSSVVPQEKPFVIKHNLFCSKLLHLQTGYSIIKKELDLADVVIAQTEQERIFINKHYRIDKSKIEVIPNGISIQFDESNRNSLLEKYDISKKYLLQVGRFDENKNQLSVIKALNGSDIPVLFVGGPDPQSMDYYQKCLLTAEDNFTFIGWLENGSPELQSAYMNAHAVILPSHKEIFGNSLIEAGAAGARLLGTESLPLESMGIGDYCVPINPKDVNDIREKILKVMKQKKIDGQSSDIKGMFSWQSVVSRHVEIYRRLLDD